MTNDRLSPGLWVRAHMRRCQAQGAMVTLISKGLDEAGTVILKVANLQGQALVLTQALDFDGNRYWMASLGLEPVLESEADAYLARQRDRDPDIWILEIEDRQARAFVDEPVRAI